MTDEWTDSVAELADAVEERMTMMADVIRDELGIEMRAQIKKELAKEIPKEGMPIDDPDVVPIIGHGGTWKQRSYGRGICVTDHGGTWLALEVTDTRPGTSGSWRLIAKSADTTQAKARRSA